MKAYNDNPVKRRSKITDGVCLNPVELLRGRLKQQEERCVQLQEALETQQRHSKKILQGKPLDELSM